MKNLDGNRNMMRIVKYLLVLAVMLMAGGVEAQDKRLAASVDELAGRQVLYSSPYLRGDEAVMIEVKQAQLSDDFVDDGLIVLNGKKYPLDQIFMQNNEGRFENLASLYAYNGAARTFLLRYYDKERLAVAEEKAKMLTDVDRCVQPFEGGDPWTTVSRSRDDNINEVWLGDDSIKEVWLGDDNIKEVWLGDDRNKDKVS